MYEYSPVYLPNNLPALNLSSFLEYLFIDLFWNKVSYVDLWCSDNETVKVNPFPNIYTFFWGRPRFKEAADDNWNKAVEGL